MIKIFMERLTRGLTYSAMFILMSMANAPAEGINGDSVIRAKAGGSEIVVTTTSRLAGAIHSLTWDGMEFIDSWDHGRQLQTAWNGNAGVDPIQGETLNPTEAGSRKDGHGANSSSKLLELRANGNALDTLSQPAFWLAPGENSGGNLARNKTIVSDHQLRKHVVIGYKNLPHAIDYHVTITLPARENDTVCVMEALTGYMPPQFEKFWTFDETTGELHAIGDGPGEQPRPLVFSAADGAHAMGIFSPGSENTHEENGPSYGRWKFKAEKVVKWNCVYRLLDSQGLAGDFHYHMFVAVGTLEDVKSTLAALTREFPSGRGKPNTPR